MQASKRGATAYRIFFGELGYAIVLIGAVLLLPLVVLPFYPQDLGYAKCFIVPGVLSIILGSIVSNFVKGKEDINFRNGEDASMVVIVWIVAILIGAIPFMLYGKYNFTQAVFETTSGFTTTGFTVTDIPHTPHIFLLYRSILQLVGGVGLILIMSSVVSGAYGMRLFNAEGHMERLEPNLLGSARVILMIYAGYIAGGTILYSVSGMSVFDAVNHSISAVSTGGFSTRVDSIGYYNSVPIDIITIILMILGGTNFLVNLFLVKGQFKKFFNHCEVKFSIGIIAIFTPIFVYLVATTLGQALPEAIINGLFQVVTTFTTTGLSTTGSFLQLAEAAMVPTLILMVIGAGAGSTAGGVKEYRACVAMKSIWWQLRGKIGNQKNIQSEQITRFGEKTQVTHQEKIDCLIYILLHIMLAAIGGWIICLCGYSFKDGLFEATSALGTIGLSIGVTSASAPLVVLWVEIIYMIIARLEIYVVLLSVIKITTIVKNDTIYLLTGRGRRKNVRNVKKLD